MEIESLADFKKRIDNKIEADPVLKDIDYYHQLAYRLGALEAAYASLYIKAKILLEKQK